TRLAEHVDLLWRRWLVLRSYKKPAESGANSYGLPSELMSQLQLNSPFDPLGFLFTTNLPTSAEVSAAVRGSDIFAGNTQELGAQMPCEHGSAVLASFTVYARPDLLVHLFRLVHALKESKANSVEIETHFFDADPSQCINTGPNKPSPLLPVWQLELISPAAVVKEEEQLILDSCRQLASVFQELSTYLFGLTLDAHCEDFPVDRGKMLIGNDDSDDKKPRPQNKVTRVIDVAMDTGNLTDYFDDTLIVRLIDGRFAAGLPSASKCNNASFLVPVTQAVYRLAMEGQATGFLTGNSADSRQIDKALPEISSSGGTGLLLHWLGSLSALTQQARSNEIIDQVRQLLSNVENLRKSCVVGDRMCPRVKPQTDNDCLASDDAEDDDSPDKWNLDDEEFKVYCEQAAQAADQANSEKQSYFIPSLSQLLKSKASRKDLTRFLDFGHFHFPLCRVSKTTILLLEQINAVAAEAESLLTQKVSTASLIPDSDPALPTQIQSIRSSALALIDVLVELVPRMILLFTSLVPVFHASLLDSDLYVAALYHNNCMYLAHECLTLGELRLFPLLAHLARLEPRAADASGDLDDDTEVESSADNLTLLRRTVSCSTFILVPQLRAAGTELLLVHLRQQRTVLSDYLKRTKGLKDIGLPENRQRCTEALTACQTTLMTVAEGLSPLPLTVFSRCIGYLCNFVCTEVVRDVLSLLDLTQTDCDVLANLLTEVDRTITHIFNEPPDMELVLHKTDEEAYLNSLARRVPELARLRGILSVLTASTMAVIERVLWNGGQGPLSVTARLEPSELRGLVTALYSNSAARDQLLRQLR
ncbi:Centromere/kinetochore protein zw10 protein, partial [Fasciolopsis buskii]